MAKYNSGAVRVYFGPYNLGTATTSVGVGLELDALDPTALGDAAERVLAGLRHDTATWAGLFDDSKAMDAAGSALLGSATNNVFTLHFGTTTGNVAYCGTSLLLMSKPVASVKELVRQEAEFKPDQTWKRGKIATPGITTYTDGVNQNGPIIDDGASSTNGGTAFVHMFAFVGTSVRIVLHHGSDTASFDEIASITFTSTGAALVAFTGTFRRYVRYSMGASVGTWTTASFHESYVRS